MGDSETPANWYADPFGRHELRYWDGTRWTEHVSSHGRQSTDAPVGAPHVPTVARPAEKIARDVARAGGAVAGSATSSAIFDQPVLVVNQKAKLIEINSEYAIFNAEGQQIGAVRQVGQNILKKLVRLLGSYDQFFTHKLQVVDMQGQPVLGITRPAKILKSKIIVTDRSGHEIGRILQQNAIGKIRFAFEAGGAQVGSLNAENWRAWNFAINDAAGVEVARITKTWEGALKTMFTTADNYVVHIHRPLAEPLRSLVVASALGVDTALKQDSRGFG